MSDKLPRGYRILTVEYRDGSLKYRPQMKSLWMWINFEYGYPARHTKECETYAKAAECIFKYDGRQIRRVCCG